jgi:hypothetical protein
VPRSIEKQHGFRMSFSHVITGFAARCSAGIVRLMRRLVFLAGTLMQRVCLAMLRAIIFSVVFTACAMAMMYYLGLPVRVPDEVVDALENLGRLTRILS